MPAGARSSPRKVTKRTPAMPAMPWTANTSRESSMPWRFFQVMAHAAAAAARTPTARAPKGLTASAAGVMPTRPAMTPVARPRRVERPLRSFSTTANPSMPPPAASREVRTT